MSEVVEIGMVSDELTGHSIVLPATSRYCGIYQQVASNYHLDWIVRSERVHGNSGLSHLGYTQVRTEPKSRIRCAACLTGGICVHRELRSECLRSLNGVVRVSVAGCSTCGTTCAVGRDASRVVAVLLEIEVNCRANATQIAPECRLLCITS